MDNRENSKLIFFTFLKTATVFIIGVCFCVSVFIGAFPKTSFALMKDLHMYKPAVSGYEKIYKESQSYEDLYNLVNVAIKAKDYKVVSFYSKKFLCDEEQAKFDFIKKIDNSTLQNADFANVAYVASVENYMLNATVSSEYLLNNKTSSRVFALSTLFNGKYESHDLCFALGTYVDLICNDLLGDELLQEFISLYNIKNEDKNFYEIFDMKINSIKLQKDTIGNVFGDVEGRKKKICLVSTLLDVLEIERDILLNVKSSLSDLEKESVDVKITNLSSEIKLVQTEYNNLVKM